MSTNQRTFLPIAIEGNIGAGKSTFCDTVRTVETLAAVGMTASDDQPARGLLACFSNNLEKGVDIVLKEDVDPSILRMFYNNPKQYAFLFQMTMALKRIYYGSLIETHLCYHNVLRDSVEFEAAPAAGVVTEPVPTERERLLLWDRSVMGDFIFALANYSLGTISREEFDVYAGVLSRRRCESFLDEHGILTVESLASLPGMGKMPFLLYMYDTPQACYTRAVRQRGNEAEKNVSMDYFTLIDNAHFLVILLSLAAQKIMNVVIVDWDIYHQNRDVLLERIRDTATAISGGSESPAPRDLALANIRWSDDWETATNIKGAVFVYSTSTLKTTHLSCFDADMSSLHINVGAMQLFLSPKTSVAEYFKAAVAYPHFAEFRHLVCSALARGKQVVLYAV